MKRDIHIERVYFHPRDLVWRALTDRDLIAQWLMKNDFVPEAGHRFTMRTDPAPGFDGVVHAEVLAIEPPRRMRWSWRGGPIDTVVTFTLSEEVVYGRPATRLRVDHQGFEGLPAVLVSFILGAGNSRVYGRLFPAVLERLSQRLSAQHPATDTGAPDTGAPDTGAPDTSAPDAGAHDTGLWYYLSRLFAPILRRSSPARPRPR